jgi:UDP-glucose 4-epimerase
MSDNRQAPARRVLVTGLSSFWGSRVAKALESDPNVETIVGLDTAEPSFELERTEFLPVDSSYSMLARVVRECGIDTILHTFLVVDPTTMTRNQMHETNVIGTMNLFAAASAPGSTVNRVIVKSSTQVYGCAPEDPVWFDEETPRSRPPRERVERSLTQVEGYVRDFAEDNPKVAVSMLRFANVLGANMQSPLTKALQLPVVPSVFGFDPRVQFVHETDVVRALLFAMSRGLEGTYNVAGDGLLPWSEVAAMCGKRVVPLPPLGESSTLRFFKTLNLVDLPPETLGLLRFGRGADNSKLKQLGFEYEFTSAQAVMDFVRAVRLKRTVGEHFGSYRYAAEVEQFFQRSPAVLKNRALITGRTSDPV